MQKRRRSRSSPLEYTGVVGGNKAKKRHSCRDLTISDIKDQIVHAGKKKCKVVLTPRSNTG